MNDYPLVSIVIPVYNAEKYIEETLKSVYAQTYTNFEVLLINDGSTDCSVSIISKYTKKDERFVLINLCKNKGVSNARNVGIDRAKGEYIAFLDSDDLWYKEKLEKQVAFMLQNDYDFSSTSYNMINDNKDYLKTIKPDFELTYLDLLHGNQIACFTVMIKKDLIKQYKFMNCKHEDYLLWLDITKMGTICHNLNTVLGSYRRSTKSLSGNKVKAALWTWNILYNYQDISLLTSLKYFICYIINSLKKHSRFS